MTKPERITNNLMNQLDKLSRHARQGSYQTRDRYKAAMVRFVSFLAVYFKLQKLANVQDKHVAAYIEYMQSKHKSPSTIKTDLAAIRYYHDQTIDPKSVISPNKAFTLTRRTIGGVDRTWSKDEFRKMVEIAEKLGQDRIVYIMHLGRYQGLRIHEALRLDRAAAERALKIGVLRVKGKNGLIRGIPLRTQTRCMFTRIMDEIPRGEKLFINPCEKTHLVIKQVQNFIIRHRAKAALAGRDANMTFHGLRHTFAAEEYEARLTAGMNEHQAKLEVSSLLGHRREDVTNLYIFSCRDDH